MAVSRPGSFTPPPTIPKIVQQVLDVFYHTVCPITGWDQTICGSYYTIRDLVNGQFGTTYEYADIGWALTWLHEHGPNKVGSTITKAGPGKRITEVLMDNGTTILVRGNIYMLEIDGQSTMTPEKMRVVYLGQIEWCDYQLSSTRNDIMDLGLMRANMPKATTVDKARRKAVQDMIDTKAKLISQTQSLRAVLVAAL